MLQLWGRMQQAPAQSLLGRVARGAVKLAQRGTAGVRKKCWAGQFFSMLKLIGSQGTDSGGAIAEFASKFGWTAPPRGYVTDVQYRMLPVPELTVWGAWDDILRSPWQGLPQNPRDAPAGGGCKYATYHRWFALPLPERLGFADEPGELDRCPKLPANMPRYIKCSRNLKFEHLVSLMRFRTGAHHSAVETGRWQRVPRHLRVCSKCTAYEVEDEVHLLFQCPAYHSIRVKYATALFSTVGGVKRCANLVLSTPTLMVEFLEQDPVLVSGFIYECLQYRRYHAPDVPFNDVGIDDCLLWLIWSVILFVLLSEAVHVLCQWGPGLAPESAPP